MIQRYTKEQSQANYLDLLDNMGKVIVQARKCNMQSLEMAMTVMLCAYEQANDYIFPIVSVQFKENQPKPIKHAPTQRTL